MTLCLKQGYISHVKKESEIPATKHWAIISFETVCVSTGYEKQGEMGDRETVTRYHVFTDEGVWRDALNQLASARMSTEPYRYRSDDFIGLVVAGRAQLSININVKVDTP